MLRSCIMYQILKIYLLTYIIMSHQPFEWRGEVNVKQTLVSSFMDEVAPFISLEGTT